MNKLSKALSTVTVAVVTTAAVAACGGGSATSATVPSASSSNKPAKSSSNPSAEFLRPKSPNNKYVRFGKEAPPKERAEASRVLEANLKAREAPHFAAQCKTLNKATIEDVVEPSTNLSVTFCARSLKRLAEPFPDTEIPRRDTLNGQISVLRVKGATAYALYHGNDEKDHAMPMTTEKGKWKIGALLTIELDPEEPPSAKPPKPNFGAGRQVRRGPG